MGHASVRILHIFGANMSFWSSLRNTPHQSKYGVEDHLDIVRSTLVSMTATASSVRMYLPAGSTSARNKTLSRVLRMGRRFAALCLEYSSTSTVPQPRFLNRASYKHMEVYIVRTTPYCAMIDWLTIDSATHKLLNDD
jgi:hypothetical protein